MAFQPDPNPFRTTSTRTEKVKDAVSIDQGLRSYMLRVYNWMASGLALTGIVAFFVANSPVLRYFYAIKTLPNGTESLSMTGVGWIAFLLPFAFILVLQFGINRLSLRSAQALFWAFCAVIGLSLSSVFMIYTGTSITSIFFISASVFASASLYGYVTKRSLLQFGSFLIMGVWGIFIAIMVNAFLLHSGGFALLLNIVGVLLFVGLSAYDTQRIKTNYINNIAGSGYDMAAKSSIFDALSMYLNFLNLFLFLLQLFGQRR